MWIAHIPFEISNSKVTRINSTEFEFQQICKKLIIIAYMYITCPFNYFAQRLPKELDCTLLRERLLTSVFWGIPWLPTNECFCLFSLLKMMDNPLFWFTMNHKIHSSFSHGSEVWNLNLSIKPVILCLIQCLKAAPLHLSIYFKTTEKTTEQ